MRRIALAAVVTAALGCATAPPPRGASYVEPPLGLAMVYVPGGEFAMGSASPEADEDERPVHPVTVSDFYLGKTEVTQAQWEAVMGGNPSEARDPTRPVTGVSWFDVQEFLRKLEKSTGKAYRLPTEAEWEFAARSGGRDEKWAGTSERDRLGDFGWTLANSGGQSQPVGQRKPNGLGLHDMTGNALEWCQDWYDRAAYRATAARDPQGPETGRQKVVRDGSFATPVAGGARTTLRDGFSPDFRGQEIGFRLARSAQ